MNITNASKVKWLQTIKISLAIKVITILTVIILLVSSISNLIIYDISFKTFKEEVRANLTSLAAYSSLSIDANQLSTIKKTEDEGNKAYLVIQKKLQIIKAMSNGKIRYVYTIMEENGHYLYSVDETPISDKLNHSTVGEKFITKDYSFLENAFKNKVAIAEKEPTPDTVYGGIVQTGYAPIINASGNVIAVIGMDMDVTYTKNIS